MKFSLGLNYNSPTAVGLTSPRTLTQGTRTAWLRRRLISRSTCSIQRRPYYVRPLLITMDCPHEKRSTTCYTTALLTLSNKSRIQKTRAKRLLAKELLAKELLAKKLRIKELFTKDLFFGGSWPFFIRVHLLFSTPNVRPLWFLTQLNLLSLFAKRLSYLKSPRALDARHPVGSTSSKLTQLVLLSIKL